MSIPTARVLGRGTEIGSFPHRIFIASFSIRLTAKVVRSWYVTSTLYRGFRRALYSHPY